MWKEVAVVYCKELQCSDKSLNPGTILPRRSSNPGRLECEEKMATKPFRPVAWEWNT